jgi:tetratricopeptide (TPR) repeat protein
MKNLFQFFVIVLVVTIVLFLYKQPVINLKRTEVLASDSTFNYHYFTTTERYSLSDSIKLELDAIEYQINRVNNFEKIPPLRVLIGKMDSLGFILSQGFIYEKLANISSNIDDWLNSGISYSNATIFVEDNSSKLYLINKATSSFKKVLELDSNHIDAKIGLGSILVEVSETPMEGIKLLKEVVDIFPLNIKANKALGLFSLQSNQYDKAIDRFQTVVYQVEDAESFFYLATAYNKKGLRNKAVETYKKSKTLTKDKILTEYIDKQLRSIYR